MSERGFGGLTRNQKSLFLAQLVESVGNFGLASAFMLWATIAGGDAVRIAQLVSWVILANTLPRIVLAPLVAWVCSHWVEYRVLQAANLARGAVCVAGFGWVAADPAGVVGPLLLAILLAVLDQFFPPARAAAAQRNLLEDQRAYFGALNFLALSGVGLLSAAITPVIFAAGGLGALLATGLGCSLLSAVVLRLGYRLVDDLEPRQQHDVAGRPPLRQALVFAFSGDRSVALVTWSVIGYGLALGLTNQSMTPLALDGLGISLATYGLIPAAFAVGGLLAYFLTVRISAKFELPVVLMAGSTLLASGYLGYGLAGSLVGCVAAMLLAGVGFGLGSSVQGAILQASVPNAMMATYVAGIAPLTPIASLLGSQLGRQMIDWMSTTSGQTAMAGYRYSYVAAAAAVLLGAVLRLASRRHN